MKAVLVSNKYPSDPAPEWQRDVMQFSPSCDSWTGSMVDCDNNDRAIIWCKDGRKFEVPASGEHRSNYAHEAVTYTNGKTVGEVMAEEGVRMAQVEHFEINVAGYNYTEGSADQDWDFVYRIYPDDNIPASDLVIAEAARKFAAKEIGFGEFKAIIKANS